MAGRVEGREEDKMAEEWKKRRKKKMIKREGNH